MDSSALWLFSLLVFLLSCKADQSLELSEYSGRVEYLEENVYQIDSLTPSVIGHAEYFLADTTIGAFTKGHYYFAIINPLTAALQFYDDNQKRMVHSIRFNRQGPDAIPGGLSYFHIKTLDSIYLSLYPQKSILLINFNGVAQSEYDMGFSDRIVELLSMGKYPLTFTPKGIYSGFFTDLPPQGYKLNKKDLRLKASVFIHDFKSGVNSVEHPFPEIYRTDKLWSQYYYRAHTVYNPGSNELVVSYASSDSIRIINLTDQTSRWSIAKSDLFSRIPHLAKRQDEFDHYRLNYAYEAMIFDPYKRLYYRLVSRPRTEDDLESPERLTSRFKTLSVIVLNEQFEKISESLIPDAYTGLCFFVSRSGLNLHNSKVGYENEDVISFGTFSYQADED